MGSKPSMARQKSGTSTHSGSAALSDIASPRSPRPIPPIDTTFEKVPHQLPFPEYLHTIIRRHFPRDVSRVIMAYAWGMHNHKDCDRKTTTEMGSKQHIIVSAFINEEHIAQVETSSPLDIVIRHVTTGELILRLPKAHRSPIRHMRNFSRLEGPLLATSSDDATAKLWLGDSYDDFSSTSVRGHTAAVVSAIQLPDGRIATGGLDSTVKIWKRDCAALGVPFVDTCELTINVGVPVVMLAAIHGFYEDKSVIVCAVGTGEQNFQVWQVLPPQGRYIRGFGYPHDDPPIAMVACGDTKHLIASAHFQHSVITVWRVSKGEVYRKFEGHSGPVFHLAVHPNGRLLSASSDRTIRFWEPVTGECLQIFRLDSGIACMTVSPCGRIMANSFDDTVAVWS